VTYWNLEDVEDSFASHTLTNNSSVSFANAGIHDNCATTSGANWLSVANHADFQFGTGDFAISIWIHPESTANGNFFLGITNTNELGLLCFVENTTLKCFLGNGTWAQGSAVSAVTQNVWNHLMLYRESGTYKVRVNDVEKISFVFGGAFDDTDAPLTLGKWDFTSEYFTGKIDEVSIWKGSPLDTNSHTALYNSGTGSYYKGPAYSSSSSSEGITSSSSSSEGITSSSSSSEGITSSSSPADDTWTANDAILRPLDSDMVAYWKAEDLTDSVNSHTLTNVNSTTFTAGKHNNAFTLNGSTQYLYTADAADLRFGTGDFTISTWFYMDELPTADPYSAYISGIYNKWYNDATNENGYALLIINGNTTPVMSFSYYNAGFVGVSSSTEILVDTWYHTVVTRVSGTITIYVNAVAGSSPLSFSGNLGDSGRAFELGTQYVSNTRSRLLNGQIDQLSIHKGHGMSLTEVQALYNSNTGSYYKGPAYSSSSSSEEITSSTSSSSEGITSSTSSTSEGITSSSISSDNPESQHWTANGNILGRLNDDMVAYWKAEDIEDSINSHTLTNVGSATYTSGKHNNAFTLNGSSQYLNVASSGLLPGTGDFTYSFWVYPTVNATVIMFATDSASYGGFYIAMVALKIEVATSAAASAPWHTVTSTGSVTLSAWNHVVLTRIGSTLYLYLNNSSDSISDSDNITTAKDLYIGANPGGNNVTGQMDEVGAWIGHGMSQAEVQALYNSATGAYWIDHAISSSSSEEITSSTSDTISSSTIT